MKKSVLYVTGFITICSVLISIYFVGDYFLDKRVEKKIQEIQELELKIKELKEEIEEKSVEKEEVIQANQEKGKLLDLWQKELKKLKA